MIEQGLEILTLPVGTVVHVCGWPVELKQATDVHSHPSNIELIRRDLYLKPQTHGIGETQIMGSGPVSSTGA